MRMVTFKHKNQKFNQTTECHVLKNSLLLSSSQVSIVTFYLGTSILSIDTKVSENSLSVVESSNGRLSVRSWSGCSISGGESTMVSETLLTASSFLACTTCIHFRQQHFSWLLKFYTHPWTESYWPTVHMSANKWKEAASYEVRTEPIIKKIQIADLWLWILKYNHKINKHQKSLHNRNCDLDLIYRNDSI